MRVGGGVGGGGSLLPFTCWSYISACDRMHVDSVGITQPLSCDGLLVPRWCSRPQSLMISWFLLTRLLIHCLYWRRSIFARWDSITKTRRFSFFWNSHSTPCLSRSLKILHSKETITECRVKPLSAHGGSIHVALRTDGCDSVTHIFWLLYCQLSPQPLTLLPLLLAASFKYSSESDQRLLTSDPWDTLLL